MKRVSGEELLSFSESAIEPERVPMAPSAEATADNETLASRPWLETWRIVALTAGLAGYQFAYSVEFAAVTPQLKHFGVSDAVVPVIWLAGPISGLVVQPVVGVYSDRCTWSWGRRRPFIFWGNVCTGVGLLTLGFAEDIGLAFGDSKDGSRPVGILILVVGLWITNASLNVIQGPSRALIADRVNEEQMHFANALCSTVLGFAAIFGYLVGFVKLSEIFSFFPRDFQGLCVVGVLVLALSATPTLVFAGEEPLEEDTTGEPSVNVFRKVMHTATRMPRFIQKICLVFFLSWCAYTPFMIQLTNYWGKEIYDGKADCSEEDEDDGKCTGGDDYRDGVRWGSLAMAIMATMCFFYGPVLSRVEKLIGLKMAYVLPQLLASLSFFSYIWLTDAEAGAFVATGLVGVNFATFNAIPFAMVIGAFSINDAGLIMGVMNVFAVVAQTVTNFISGGFISAFDGNVSAGLAAGGVFGLLASASVFFLDEKPTGPEVEGLSTSLLDPTAPVDIPGESIN